MLCGLTNEIADFDERGCQSYQEDKAEREVSKSKANELLKTIYPAPSIIKKGLGEKSFKSSKELIIDDVEIANGIQLIETNKNKFIY